MKKVMLIFLDTLNLDKEIIENDRMIINTIKQNDSIYDVTYKIIKSKEDITYNELIFFIFFWLNILTYKIKNDLTEDFKFNYPNLKISGSIKISNNGTYIIINGENKNLFRYLTRRIIYNNPISYDLIENYSFIRILKYVNMYLKNRNIIYSNEIKEYGFPNFLLPFQVCENDKVIWIYKYPPVDHQIIRKCLENINLTYNNVSKKILYLSYKDKNNIEMVFDVNDPNDDKLFIRNLLKYDIYYVYNK